MKKLLLLVLIPFLGLSQVQIGADIDGDSGDRFGHILSLSANGNILAVGAPYNNQNGNRSGSVRIYENINSTWTQIGSDIDGNTSDDNLGYSLSLSDNGNIVAIGAFGINTNGYNSGAVRLYENQGAVWTQLGQDINGENVSDLCGFSLSLSGDGTVVAISSPFNDSNGLDSGSVHIYENQGNNWVQVGQDINGEAADDNSGWSVSLSKNGEFVIIGAVRNDANGNNTGHARIFRNINNNWVQIGQDIDGEVGGTQSATSVGISSNGNIIAIGSPYNNNFTGYVKVYEIINNIWLQIGNNINGDNVGDQFGFSLSLSNDGNIIAVGIPYKDTNGSDSGSFKIYQNQNSNWVQVANEINGEASQDTFGYSIDISNDANIVAVGSNRNDGNGLDSGHVRVFDLSGITLDSDSFVLDNFSISPNPTTDKVNITLNTNLELKVVTVYNYFGQKIKTTQSTEIDLSNLSTGVYFLEIETNKGKASKKIIKK
jgi:hypothetical protein